MFLHHSTGEALIDQGGVREGLTRLGYEFYDHGYNDDGLRLADGSYTGTNFDIPGDNTDPDGFAEIFAQPLHDPPDNAFSHLMQYDVIAFKSCFPTSNIGSDEQLAEYRSYYLSIRDRMDQYPNRAFVVVTPPPQVPNHTDAEEGARVRAFADWLQSDEYLAGHPNVFVFDFFDLLAGSDNFLRAEYRMDEYDAHPNERANREIGPLFVEFIHLVVQNHSAGEPLPLPTEAQPPAEEPDDPTAEPISPPSADRASIDDFESPLTDWWTDAEPASSIACSQDTKVAHVGSGALRIDYSIEPGSWPACGRSFEDSQDWSGSSGLSFWLRGSESGRAVTLLLFSGPADAPTPLETHLQTSSDWVFVTLPWSAFTQADWADEDGLVQIDPSRMSGYAFSVGTDDSAAEGTLWIDDVSSYSGEGAPLANTPPSEELDAEEHAEEEPSSDICPFSAFGLPLATLGAGLVLRRKETT
jgi:hypothetical protein